MAPPCRPSLTKHNWKTDGACWRSYPTYPMQPAQQVAPLLLRRCKRLLSGSRLRRTCSCSCRVLLCLVVRERQVELLELLLLLSFVVIRCPGLPVPRVLTPILKRVRYPVLMLTPTDES